MTPFVRTFLSLPRAARWLVYLGVGLAVYFVAAVPILNVRDGLRSRIDGVRSELDSYARARGADERAGVAVRSGRSIFGAVAFPGDPAERSEAFNRGVAEVLARHGIQNDRRTARIAPLDSGPLDAALDPGRRISRLVMDIQFEASPEQVVMVLADLESMPEVAAVSRVQMRRETAGESAGARTVRANISAEAWLLARKEDRQ